MVDGHSTDKMVENARKFPVKGGGSVYEDYRTVREARHTERRDWEPCQDETSILRQEGKEAPKLQAADGVRGWAEECARMACGELGRYKGEWGNFE